MRNSQSGSALAISLVLLTVITIISITSLQRSGLQSKIVGNLQHKEQLFTAANSDQEHWFLTAQEDDAYLSQALQNRALNPDGEAIFSSVPLPDRQVYQHIDSNSTLQHIPNGDSKIALSSGYETNNRIKFLFILDSLATQKNGNKRSSQQSGLEFPGLNSARSTAF